MSLSGNVLVVEPGRAKTQQLLYMTAQCLRSCLRFVKCYYQKVEKEWDQGNRTRAVVEESTVFSR